MATLTVNPSKLRATKLYRPKPISSSLSDAKPINVSFPVSRIPPKNSLLRQIPSQTSFSSVSESPVTPTTENPGVPSSAEDEVDDPMAELSYLDQDVDPESISEWELDFCSRPILDIRGKKIWELVVCDSTLSLQYTKYFPNNVINSITLKEAIVSICDTLDVPLPEKIRFFRSQMQTIITKACTELGIKPVPSKRCLALLLWLEERYESVYTRHPGFQKGAKPLLALDKPFPMDLPENLFGERWAFVQLPFSAVKEEVSVLETSFAFGANLDLDLLGLDIDDKTLVPGLAVTSSRAKPLAGWMNGLEVCSIEADTSRASLILSVGVATRYIYATYKKSARTTEEAEAWEAAKKDCGGLHFLAIQESLDSEDCVGFWLLIDLPPPPTTGNVLREERTGGIVKIWNSSELVGHRKQEGFSNVTKRFCNKPASALRSLAHSGSSEMQLGYNHKKSVIHDIKYHLLHFTIQLQLNAGIHTTFPLPKSKTPWNHPMLGNGEGPGEDQFPPKDEGGRRKTMGAKCRPACPWMAQFCIHQSLGIWYKHLSSFFVLKMTVRRASLLPKQKFRSQSSYLRWLKSNKTSQQTVQNESSETK
ncbi:hypothetical protein H6P81_000982 [Aristolochia fimbriata]|uniref:Uncharacterized protein n=1 Tax=Aristolochia fimbriata TaxID=158543 RepID=A0AAV7F787_ARIFI|nr:hypothetical protein H6P81_000982 [Aristolochia fimbriata]